jgi:hypothetical protein
MDFYQPWKDADPYDKFIAQQRLNLRKGVIAEQEAGNISRRVAKRLKKICDKIDIVFFYPIVYRIDISTIPTQRIRIAGSSTTGSSEILIDDLGEKEFDILFLDFSGDSDFDQLKDGTVGDTGFARPILEGRC